MNLNELMVGDWVEDTYHNKFVQWNPRLWFMEINGHITDRPVEGRDYKPIPLTPEILEKNGFKHEHNTNKGWLSLVDYPKWCVYIKADETPCRLIADNLSSVDNIREGVFVNKWISSVHELQYALRFCGIEKEVVLC